jgi:N-acetylmuramoyl-L-alanine amidase
MQGDTINIFKFLNIYDIQYDYDPILKKLTVDKKIEIVDGFEYYKNQKNIKKSDKISQNKSDGFYVSIDVLKDISKTILEDKVDIIEDKGSINIFNKTEEEKLKDFPKNKQTINENRNYKIDVIIIDLGHGGKDPGTIGNNLLEKNIILETGLELEKEFKKQFPNIDIVITRNTDVFHTLQKRAEIANKAAALDTKNPKNAIFISIHANASFNKSAKGLEVFFLKSQESSEYARAVSMFEHSASVRFNNVDSQKYTDYTKTAYYYMLIEQYQKESQLFAQMVVDETYKIKGVSKRSTPVQTAFFYVLKGSVMPSILIELGFLTNADDAKLLKSKKFQQDVSKSIATALKKYIKEFEDTKGFTK